MEQFMVRIVIAFALAVSFGAANAASILYSVASIGGTTWRYDYVVLNDSTALPIEEFSVFFEEGTFQNLVSLAAPADWDVIAVQPDATLSSAGFVDGLALAAGIPPGGTLGGFSVSFTYLGAGTPGPQPFAIVDPLTFATTASGSTTLFVAPPQPPTNVPIPLPGTLTLLGVVALTWVRARTNLWKLRIRQAS
jgi:hypothetical protein